MVYFDKTNLKILKAVYHSKGNGITLGKLRSRFEANYNKYHEETLALSIFLFELCEEGYIFCPNRHEKWSYTDLDSKPFFFFDESLYIITNKGSELLQRRSFDFWKWMIPTFISVVALVVSAITAN